MPGTIVFLAGVGWLPLIMAVAGLPGAGDLAFFGAALLGSGSYPWNVAALSVSLLAGIAAVLLLLAAGEGEILDRLAGERRGLAGVWRNAGTLALAALPAALVLVGLVWAVAVAAPAAYANPDPADPFWVQVARSVLPWLLALLVVVVVCQALGAAALRRAGPRRFGRISLRLVSMAAAGSSLIVAVLVTTWLVVVTVWAEVGQRLASGRIVDPATVGLMMTLVGAWLVLVLVGGTLQAFLSAWWSVAMEDAG